LDIIFPGKDASVVVNSGNTTTQKEKINVGKAVRSKTMKKSILVLSLVALLGLNVLALGTSTAVKSTIQLASGKTLVTLQATYGGMWPTSPPLAFFVTAVSDGLTTSEYITWAGSQRFIELDLVLPPGTYFAQSAAYVAVLSAIQVAPDGLPEGGVEVVIPAPDSPSIPTLNVPAPYMNVTTEEGVVIIDLSYSMDNLIGTGAIDYSFEVIDTYGTQTKRYYTATSQIIIEDVLEGQHIYQARIIAEFPESVALSPLSSPKVVEVVPSSKLIVPWYANLNEWSTVVGLTCETEGQPIIVEFILYKYITVGDREILFEDTISFQETSSIYPILFNISELSEYESGFMEVNVIGAKARGLTMLMRNGEIKTFDASPLMLNKDASIYHLVPFQISGPYNEFNANHSYSILNTSNSPVTVHFVYHFLDNGCFAGPKTVTTAPFIVRPKETRAEAYSYAYMKSLAGIVSMCSEPLIFSVEIVASLPVYVQAAEWDQTGGFGLWNN